MSKTNKSVIKQNHKPVGLAKVLHDNYLLHGDSTNVIVFDEGLIADILKYMLDHQNYNPDEYISMCNFYYRYCLPRIVKRVKR